MNIEHMIAESEKQLKGVFEQIDERSYENQRRVLSAFQRHKVAPHHFSGTTGYGYSDLGRETLSNIFADLFGTESAIVSPLISGGTHALTLAMFGLLKTGEVLLSVTDAPYDTLMPVINGIGNGSLSDYGIGYQQVALKQDCFDFEAITEALRDEKIKVAFIQRSKGYSQRDAFSVSEIGQAARFIKNLRSDVVVMVDNCYGEFVETIEPTHVGADVAVGSLIKNIGGGLAPTGGYIAGDVKSIERISYRLTAPGIGFEVGSYAYGYQYYYQGLFLAPHIVAQALKTSCLFGNVFEKIGYKTWPNSLDVPHDIIRSIQFNTETELVAFCQAIQYVSPVDSYVTPEPWDMPGYEHRVIMAAGTFVGGASIELSCDSPIKQPYTAYLQGGLTYEHGKIAVTQCLSSLIKAVK